MCINTQTPKQEKFCISEKGRMNEHGYAEEVIEALSILFT